MALTTRNRWCIDKVAHFFQDEIKDDAKLQGFIRRPDVLSQFNSLFSGDCVTSLFVHYQTVAEHDLINVSISYHTFRTI